MDRIRKLESELMETKAVNLQSKQIWIATMKDDVDKVEQLRLEVTKMVQEKKDMGRLYETKLTEMAQEREAARTTHHVKALQKETHTEEPKEKYDGVENLRQEVVKMAQEKNICSESSKKF